jgi:hypothetical protein
MTNQVQRYKACISPTQRVHIFQMILTINKHCVLCEVQTESLYHVHSTKAPRSNQHHTRVCVSVCVLLQTV